MLRWTLGILVWMAAGAGVWLYKSPEWQMAKVEEGIRAGDPSALVEHIDFGLVQKDAARQFRDRLGEQVWAGELDPERMTELSAKADDFAAGMFNEGVIRSFTYGGDGEPLPPMDIQRTGLQSFKAEMPGGGAMRYELQGLTWRAVGIDIPFDEPAKQGPIKG